MPVQSKSARIIHVKDEKSDHVFRILVSERKSMAFLPGIEKKATEVLSIPYVEAAFDVPFGMPPHELTTKQIGEVLFAIVQIEGPIHEDELTSRVRDLWGLGRAGSRIQDVVTRGIRSLLDSNRCQREGECLFLANEPVKVRNRETVKSASLRRAEMLPGLEIRLAIENIVKAHFGANSREIVTAVARLFGFRSTSSILRETIEMQIDAMRKMGTLSEQDGLLRWQASREMFHT